jgi:methyltransferase (TIGR00027 family)
MMSAMVAESDTSPGGVGETAIGAAMMRARESARADPLFNDPYAAAFVDAAPPVFEDGPTPDEDPDIATLEAAFQDAISVRTRFYDEFVLGAVESGCQQVVLLGAGLDSRAFRLTWPHDVRLFEVDTPDVLAFKESVLSGLGAVPGCGRAIVPADFRQDWTGALANAGFHPNDSTAWVAEGLIPYLPDDDARRLLVGIGDLSSSRTSLALDQPTIPEDSLLSRAQSVRALDEITSMWKGGMRENAISWLREHGWYAEPVEGSSLAAQYRRMSSAVTNDVYVRATRFEAQSPTIAP